MTDCPEPIVIPKVQLATPVPQVEVAVVTATVNHIEILSEDRVITVPKEER